MAVKSQGFDAKCRGKKTQKKKMVNRCRETLVGILSCFFKSEHATDTANCKVKVVTREALLHR